MGTYETIRYEVNAPEGRITLNRPEVRNAINHEMEREVKDALRVADADPDVRVIVLTGSAPAFCSGIDLNLHQRRTVLEARSHFEAFYWGLHTTHRSLSKPTIAAVNGPAREAGCTMAYMCDTLIASETASFGLPAVHRGILPAYHLVYLQRVVGKAKAFELCFSGEPISAHEAERLGIANHVASPQDFEDVVAGMVDNFAKTSPLVMKVGRELFYRSMDVEFEKAMRSAADVVALMAGFDDAVEGMTAYVEKRDPQWTGS